ncbi:hypothetical protein, partial [Mycolicibacterium vanbaalenii]|uniref:hypothetical protein n=1 Tax=Mycolicibacterium vanbaalenii TaxID=110539 RepID=UPI0021F3A6BD
SFSVTDEAGVQSLVPGAAIVNVIGLPPTVTVFGIPIFKLGGAPVKVVSSVTSETWIRRTCPKPPL